MATCSGWDPGLPPTAMDGKPTVPVWMGGVGIGQLQILSLYATDGEKKLSPFVVGKSMQDLVGEIEGTTTESNGMKYVLRVRDAGQARKLLGMKALFDGTDVKVELHPILNKRRCVISCREIQDESDEELLKWMAKEGVVGVRRITRMQDGNRVNTPTIILTLNGTSVPDYIRVGALRIMTRIYIPDPMICYKCFAYGHSKFRCKGVQKCRNCSNIHDLEGECKADPFCFNCQGQHSPTSRNCPTYVMEKEITRLRFTRGITYQEALKQTKAGGGSYAQVSQVQQRLVTARTATIESEQLKEKDSIIKQLQETIAKLTSRIEDLESKNRTKKEKKRAKHAKHQEEGTDTGNEMDTDSSIKGPIAADGDSLQASSTSSKVSQAKSSVHKRHYTTEIHPPNFKKTPANLNIDPDQIHSPSFSRPQDLPLVQPYQKTSANGMEINQTQSPIVPPPLVTPPKLLNNAHRNNPHK